MFGLMLITLTAYGCFVLLAAKSVVNQAVSTASSTTSSIDSSTISNVSTTTPLAADDSTPVLAVPQNGLGAEGVAVLAQEKNKEPRKQVRRMSVVRVTSQRPNGVKK